MRPHLRHVRLRETLPMLLESGSPKDFSPDWGLHRTSCGIKKGQRLCAGIRHLPEQVQICHRKLTLKSSATRCKRAEEQ